MSLTLPCLILSLPWFSSVETTDEKLCEQTGEAKSSHFHCCWGLNPTIPMVCIWCFGYYFAVLWEVQGGRSLGLEEDAGKCFKPIIRSGIGLPSWLTPVELCTAPSNRFALRDGKKTQEFNRAKVSFHILFGAQKVLFHLRHLELV